MMEPDMLMDDEMGSDGDDVGLDRDKDDGGLDALMLPAKRLRLADADAAEEEPELNGGNLQAKAADDASSTGTMFDYENSDSEIK